MNLALLEGLGLKDKLVYFDHSCHLKNDARQYEKMQESVNGAIKRFNIDPAKVFDIQTQQAQAIAKFKEEAEKSSAKNPLWFCCAGPMEMPWRCINAVDPAYRPFINCISHSSPFNEKHVSPSKMYGDRFVRVGLFVFSSFYLRLGQGCKRRFERTADLIAT